MIQRIQTVYLALAAIVFAITSMVRLPLYTIASDEEVYLLMPSGVLFRGAEVMQAHPLLAGIALSLLLIIYSIAQYKNRLFQVKIAKLSMLTQLLTMALIFYYGDRMAGLLPEGAEHTASVSPLVAAPVVSVGLTMLAVRAIMKDERLVRSADRLR